MTGRIEPQFAVSPTTQETKLVRTADLAPAANFLISQIGDFSQNLAAIWERTTDSICHHLAVGFPDVAVIGLNADAANGEFETHSVSSFECSWPLLRIAMNEAMRHVWSNRALSNCLTTIMRLPIG